MSFCTSSVFLSLKAFQTAVSRTTNASLSEMAIAIIVVANKKTIGYAKYFFISVFVVATALCRRALRTKHRLDRARRLQVCGRVRAGPASQSPLPHFVNFVA